MITKKITKNITKKIKKLCKGLKIKLTKKINGKRVSKTKIVILKEIKKKIKINKSRFGEDQVKKPWYKNKKKLLKIAAGTALVAGTLVGGHYVARHTKTGKKVFTSYNNRLDQRAIKKTNTLSKSQTKVNHQESQVNHNTHSKPRNNNREDEELSQDNLDEPSKPSNKMFLINNANVLALGSLAGGEYDFNTGNNALDKLANNMAKQGYDQAIQISSNLQNNEEELDKLHERLENNPTNERLHTEIMQKEQEQENLEIKQAEIEKRNMEIAQILNKLNKIKQLPKTKDPKQIKNRKKKIKKLESRLKDLRNQSEFGKKRKYSFGTKRYRRVIEFSKKKFYQISKLIAISLLMGIGIFTGISISLVAFIKYLEYRKVKIDPIFALKLFKSTDQKGKLYIDNFIDSLGGSGKRWIKDNSQEIISVISKEIRRESPQLVKEATLDGLTVVKQNATMLMFPLMLALSEQFKKQMGELTIASAKKSRSDAAKQGYETRKKKIESAKKFQAEFRRYLKKSCRKSDPILQPLTKRQIAARKGLETRKKKIESAKKIQAAFRGYLKKK
jgi:hypothetical protein